MRISICGMLGHKYRRVGEVMVCERCKAVKCEKDKTWPRKLQTREGGK